MRLSLVCAFVLSFSSTFSHASSLIYVPEKFNPATARVVALIHGCLQSPESMALGAGWNAIADKNNLVVVYPQVQSGSHPTDCWSWYLPENQSPVSGQLVQVRDEIKTWKKRLGIEKAPVFAAGLSSGAATTSGLIACFPSEFAGGAVHSGLSYGLASNVEEAQKVLKEGPEGVVTDNRPCNPQAANKPVLVIHGALDLRVSPKHVKRLISDFFGSAQGSGPSRKLENGMSYTTEEYLEGAKLRGRVVIIEGLGHAWAGYTKNLRHSELLGPNSKTPTKVPFFEAKGPSSTDLIFEFMQAVMPAQ